MSDAPAPGGPDTAATAPDTADPGVVPRAKLWLEVDGTIALSEWRVALLEGLIQTFVTPDVVAATTRRR